MKKLTVRRISLYRTAKLCARYILNDPLGEGGSGVVYAGIRKTDGKKLGDTNKLPVEVALMELVSKPPRCPHIIELLEWFDSLNFYILVLEWPEPCIDLFKYCENNVLPDNVVKYIIHQVAVAASHCLERGVFHRDIKEENILINPNTFDVKLIDFGFGDLLKDFYIDYSGTAVFAPPEVQNGEWYQAESATVWGLGILLYSLLCGYVPYKNMLEIRKGNLYLPEFLSEGPCRLITWCLEPKPNDRPTLQQFLAHDWLESGQQNRH
ncbi:Serine/threonine-protein kinase pim-2 [Bagarius yarrelli]|uniref:non-specific serine/threonine protein kinase n=1 Tax=Bagarius yarrelli TaxID=175774 RepID=A0A556TKQ8_BAGYA|nr:Serine/threonine-protein kinase pim-2 [Bagarius yarrelli]